MLKKVVFCITELWTENIKKFDHAPNDFVPNVLSVKNTPWNSCIAFLSDSLFNVNMAQHVFLSKKFRKNLKSFFCLWCKLFWHGKMKEKRVGKDQFFWRKQPLSGRIFLKEYYTSHPYQQAKLKSTLFAFYYSMLLSQRKSKSSLNANVSRIGRIILRGTYSDFLWRAHALKEYLILQMHLHSFVFLELI